MSNSGNMGRIDVRVPGCKKNSGETVTMWQMRDDGGFDHHVDVDMMWNSHFLSLFHR